MTTMKGQKHVGMNEKEAASDWFESGRVSRFLTLAAAHGSLPPLPGPATPPGTSTAALAAAGHGASTSSAAAQQPGAPTAAAQVLPDGWAAVARAVHLPPCQHSGCGAHVGCKKAAGGLAETLKPRLTRAGWACAKKLAARGASHLTRARNLVGPNGEQLLLLRTRVALQARDGDVCNIRGAERMGVAPTRTAATLQDWAVAVTAHNFAAPSSTVGTSGSITMLDNPTRYSGTGAADGTSPEPVNNNANNIYTAAPLPQLRPVHARGRDGAAGADAAAYEPVLQAMEIALGLPRGVADGGPASIIKPPQPAARTLEVEVLVDANTWQLHAAATPCCGGGWDPMCNALCPVVATVLLQAARRDDITLCEEDVASLVESCEPGTLGSMTLDGLISPRTSIPLRRTPATHDEQPSGAAHLLCLLSSLSSPSPALAPSVHPPAPTAAEDGKASQLMGRPAAMAAVPAVPLVPLSWEVLPVLEDTAGRSTLSSLAPHLLAPGPGPGTQDAVADSSLVPMLSVWELHPGHPSFYREDFHIKLAQERYRAGWTFEGAQLDLEDLPKYMEKLGDRHTAQPSWSGLMRLLANKAPTPSAPGTSAGPQGPTDTALDKWCTCVLKAFDRAVSLPGQDVSGAVCELMRVMWHGLHRWELDDSLARRMRIVVQGLARLLLCCAVARPLRHAVAVRLAVWRTKLADAWLRFTRSRTSYYGMAEPGRNIPLLHDDMLHLERLAVMGWEAPLIKSVLHSSIPTTAAVPAGSSSRTHAPHVSSAYGSAGAEEGPGGEAGGGDVGREEGLALTLKGPGMDVPARLALLDHFSLHSEYVALACAAHEWVAAVRKLVQLGGRHNIARATQITVHAVPAPHAKVALAHCLMTAALAQFTRVGAGGAGISGSPEPRAAPAPGAAAGAGDELAAALMAATPQLPATFVAGCAGAMFMSAAKALASLPPNSPALKAELLSLREPSASNAWVSTLSKVFEMLSRVLSEESARRQADAEAEASLAAGYYPYSSFAPAPTGPCAGSMPTGAQATPCTAPAAVGEEGPASVVLAGAAEGSGARASGPLTLAPVGADGEVYDLLKQVMALLRETEVAGTSPEDIWSRLLPLLRGEMPARAFQVQTLNRVLAGSNADPQELSDLMQCLLEGAFGSMPADAITQALPSVWDLVRVAWGEGFRRSQMYALLPVSEGCLVTEPADAAIFSRTVPVPYSNSAYTQSLAMCAVHSLLEQRLSTVLQGGVRRGREVVGLIEGVESILRACCDDVMPEKVQLQAIAEGSVVCLTALVAHLQSAPSGPDVPTIQELRAIARNLGPAIDPAEAMQAATLALQALRRMQQRGGLPGNGSGTAHSCGPLLGRLAGELAGRGLLQLGWDLAAAHLQQARTPESAARLLELSVALGKAAQLKALSLMFDPLWHRPKREMCKCGRYHDDDDDDARPGYYGGRARNYESYHRGLMMDLDGMSDDESDSYEFDSDEDLYLEQAGPRAMDDETLERVMQRAMMQIGDAMHGRPDPMDYAMHGAYGLDLHEWDLDSDESDPYDMHARDELRPPLDAAGVVAELLRGQLRPRGGGEAAAGGDPAPSLAPRDVKIGEVIHISDSDASESDDSRHVVGGRQRGDGAAGEAASVGAGAAPTDYEMEDTEEGAGPGPATLAGREGHTSVPDAAAGPLGAGGGGNGAGANAAAAAAAAAGQLPPRRRRAQGARLTIADALHDAGPRDAGGAGPSGVRPAGNTRGRPPARGTRGHGRRPGGIGASPRRKRGSYPAASGNSNGSSSVATDELLGGGVGVGGNGGAPGEVSSKPGAADTDALPGVLRKLARAAHRSGAGGNRGGGGGGGGTRGKPEGPSYDAPSEDPPSSEAGSLDAADGVAGQKRKRQQRTANKDANGMGNGRARKAPRLGRNGGAGYSDSETGWDAPVRQEQQQQQQHRTPDAILARITICTKRELRSVMQPYGTGRPDHAALTTGSADQDFFALAQYIKGRGACAEVVACLMASAVCLFEGQGAAHSTGLMPGAAARDWNEFMGEMAAMQSPPLTEAPAHAARHYTYPGAGAQDGAAASPDGALVLRGTPARSWEEFLRMRQQHDRTALARLQTHFYRPERSTFELTPQRLEVLTAWAVAAYGAELRMHAGAGAGRSSAGGTGQGEEGAAVHEGVAGTSVAAAAATPAPSGGEEHSRTGSRTAADSSSGSDEDGEEGESAAAGLRMVLRGMAAGVQKRYGAALAHLADAMLSVPGVGLEADALTVLKAGILPNVSRYSGLYQTYTYSPLVTPLYRTLYKRLAVRLASLVVKLRAAATPPVVAAPTNQLYGPLRKSRPPPASSIAPPTAMDVDGDGTKDVAGQQGPAAGVAAPAASKAKGVKRTTGKGGAGAKRSKSTTPEAGLETASVPDVGAAAAALATASAAAATIAAAVPAGTGNRRSSRSRAATPVPTGAPAPASGTASAQPTAPATTCAPSSAAAANTATAAPPAPAAHVPSGGPLTEHPWPLPEAVRLLAQAEPLLGDLARTMVLAQVPLPAELLQQPVVVRSVMSFFNELMSRFRTDGDTNLALFDAPGVSSASATLQSSLRAWLPVAFCKVVLQPLRNASPAVQQTFMAAAASMSDAELNFRLKVPLLEWASSAHVPVATLFTAASRALSSATDTLRAAGAAVGVGAPETFSAWLQQKQKAVTDWTAACKVAAAARKPPPVPPGTKAAGSTAAVTGQRKWLWYILKWLSTQLARAVEAEGGAALLGTTSSNANGSSSRGAERGGRGGLRTALGLGPLGLGPQHTPLAGLPTTDSPVAMIRSLMVHVQGFSGPELLPLAVVVLQAATSVAATAGAQGAPSPGGTQELDTDVPAAGSGGGRGRGRGRSPAKQGRGSGSQGAGVPKGAAAVASATHPALLLAQPLWEDGIELLRRSVLPRCSAWAELPSSEAWGSADYRTLLDKLVAAQSLHNPAQGGAAAPHNSDAQDTPAAWAGGAGGSDGNGATGKAGVADKLWLPLPDELFMAVALTRLHCTRDLRGVVTLCRVLEGRPPLTRPSTGPSEVEVVLPHDCVDGIAAELPFLPVRWLSSSCAERDRSGGITLLKLRPDVADHLLQVHVGGTGETALAAARLRFLQVQVEAARSAAASSQANTSRGGGVKAAAATAGAAAADAAAGGPLAAALQPLPGMPLSHSIQVWIHLLDMLREPLNAGPPVLAVSGESSATGAGAGVLATLETALRPLTMAPVPVGRGAHVVADEFMRVEAAVRSALAGLPPQLRRTALLLRVASGVASLSATAADHPIQPHQAPNPPQIAPPADMGQAAAQVFICEGVAKDIVTLYALDPNACLSAFNLTSSTPPPSTSSAAQGLLPLGGGVLVESAKCIAAGRFSPFMRALGEHVRTHPEFFVVYKHFRASLPQLDNKLIRYMTRMADASEEGLAAKIARDYNVAAIDELQTRILPWRSQVHGQKLVRARELAAWIWSHKTDYMGTHYMLLYG